MHPPTTIDQSVVSVYFEFLGKNIVTLQPIVANPPETHKLFSCDTTILSYYSVIMYVLTSVAS